MGPRRYGHEHQQLRARWSPKVNRGLVDCARCRKPIEPGTAWDLGHDDGGGWHGPEHAWCNRSAGGSNGALVTNAIRRAVRRTRIRQPAHTSRAW